MKILSYQSTEVLTILLTNGVYYAEDDKKRENRDYSLDIEQLGGHRPVWGFQLAPSHTKELIYTGAMYDTHKCEMTGSYSALEGKLLLELEVPDGLIKTGLTHNAYKYSKVFPYIREEWLIASYEINHLDKSRCSWKNMVLTRNYLNRNSLEVPMFQESFRVITPEEYDFNEDLINSNEQLIYIPSYTPKQKPIEYFKSVTMIIKEALRLLGLHPMDYLSYHSDQDDEDMLYISGMLKEQYNDIRIVGSGDIGITFKSTFFPNLVFKWIISPPEVSDTLDDFELSNHKLIGYDIASLPENLKNYLPKVYYQDTQYILSEFVPLSKVMSSDKGFFTFREIDPRSEKAKKVIPQYLDFLEAGYHFTDLHEDNLTYDSSTGDLKIVDLDFLFKCDNPFTQEILSDMAKLQMAIRKHLPAINVAITVFDFKKYVADLLVERFLLKESNSINKYKTVSPDFKVKD